MKTFVGTVFILFLIVAAVVLGPLVLLYGLNLILAPAGYATVPYTMSTWFGALILGFCLRGSVSSSSEG